MSLTAPTAEYDRRAIAALEAAAKARAAGDRKHFLNQAALFAFKSEQSRRVGCPTDPLASRPAIEEP